MKKFTLAALPSQNGVKLFTFKTSTINKNYVPFKNGVVGLFAYNESEYNAGDDLGVSFYEVLILEIMRIIMKGIHLQESNKSHNGVSKLKNFIA